jgi:hypothetical protein
MRKLLQPLILIALISACSRPAEPVTSAIPGVAIAPIDLSTPDRAIKSYWAVRDKVRHAHYEMLRRSIDVYRSAEKEIGSVSGGALARSFAWDVIATPNFGRDILDVKVESESRAIVIAVIKNTTPLPAGAEVSKFDEERRRDGERYRYVLEKDASGWKVSEIWAWERYPRPDWKKNHPRDDKPYVPSMTHDGV